MPTNQELIHSMCAAIERDTLDADVFDVPIALADWLAACREQKEGRFIGNATVLRLCEQKVIAELRQATKRMIGSSRKQTLDLFKQTRVA